MPMVVFGNACQSATRGVEGDTAQVFGWPCVLTAGVRHYLGTQWEIVDGQSGAVRRRAVSPPGRRQRPSARRCVTRARR